MPEHRVSFSQPIDSSFISSYCQNCMYHGTACNPVRGARGVVIRHPKKNPSYAMRGAACASPFDGYGFHKDGTPKGRQGLVEGVKTTRKRKRLGMITW